MQVEDDVARARTGRQAGTQARTHTGAEAEAEANKISFIRASSKVRLKRTTHWCAGRKNKHHAHTDKLY